MRTGSGTTQTTLIGIAVVIVAGIAAIAAFLLMDADRPLAPLGPEYTYDLSEYAVIDPDLILYEQIGQTFPTGLAQSRVITVGPDNTLWVAGDKQIVQFSSDGRRLGTIDCPAEPIAIAPDADGLLYAGLIDHIAVYDTNGAVIAQWQRPHEQALLTSLALQGGYIFAADAGSRSVWRYSTEGQVVAQFGQRDADRNHPGFVIPSPYGFNLAAAPDGLLRIVNSGRHLVEAWTIDGHREWWWGRPFIGIEGFSGCCNPAALAVLPNGHYITSEKGLVRIKEYDPQGELIGVVAGPEQLEIIGSMRVYERPQDAQVRGFGVAADADGRVYVLDIFRNVVRVFEKKEL